MSSSIVYLTSKADFRQISDAVPITKQRNSDKVDTPEAFEGALHPHEIIMSAHCCFSAYSANKKELVADLVTKAKQIKYLIQSLPVPEPEEKQVFSSSNSCPIALLTPGTRRRR